MNSKSELEQDKTETVLYYVSSSLWLVVVRNLLIERFSRPSPGKWWDRALYANHCHLIMGNLNSPSFPFRFRLYIQVFPLLLWPFRLLKTVFLKPFANAWPICWVHVLSFHLLVWSTSLSKSVGCSRNF